MNKIEEEFFKTFEIEPKWKDKRVKNTKTYYTEEQAQYLRQATKNRNVQLCYPQITDRILLELICIFNEYFISPYGTETKSINKLKEQILEDNICAFNNKYLKGEYKIKYKQQVQALFRGEE